MVDTSDSKSDAGDSVPVQVRPPVPYNEKAPLADSGAFFCQKNRNPLLSNKNTAKAHAANTRSISDPCLHSTSRQLWRILK